MTNIDKNVAQFKAKFTSDSGIFVLIQPTNFLLSQNKDNLLNLEVKELISLFHSLQ
jgi:hypothetical protein